MSAIPPTLLLTSIKLLISKPKALPRVKRSLIIGCVFVCPFSGGLRTSSSAADLLLRYVVSELWLSGYRTSLPIMLASLAQLANCIVWAVCPTRRRIFRADPRRSPIKGAKGDSGHGQ